MRTAALHDLQQVCDLFARTFRKSRKPLLSKVQAALAETYFTSPLDAARPASLVHIDADGRVRGFLGVIAVRARLGDVPLQGGIIGNFMAEDDAKARSALKLIRSLVRSDLDFVFTDTANQTSLRLSRGFGFDFIGANSLEWMKLLSPARAGAYLATRRSRQIGKLLGPLADLADIAARRHPVAQTVAPAHEAFVDEAVDAETFVSLAPVLMERHRFGLSSDEKQLLWILGQARAKTRNGQLALRRLLDSRGRTAALYLIYVKPGGVAHLLQIYARGRLEAAALSAAFDFARASGAIAVKGASSTSIIEGLSRQPGVLFRHVSSTILHSRRPDVRTAATSGNAAIGGLFGESWTQLATDDFA